MRSVIIIDENDYYLQGIFYEKIEDLEKEKNTNACGLLDLALYLHGLRP
jgi:hypothetical protein